MIRNTPAQASFCQFSYGLIANLKIVTGRLAIGWLRSLVQNWFDSAVKSSGAVSPAMRASASRTPVMTPARAALQGHGHDDPPLRRAERIGRLAQRVRDQRQHVLGRADDDRDDDQRQRQHAGQAGEDCFARATTTA